LSFVTIAGSSIDAAPYEPQWRPREGSLTLRGLRHRVLYWDAADGEANCPLVVLLHGFQDCSDTYQFLVDALPRHWRFVGLDWRGFGGSHWQDQPYWFADYLADLDALLDQVSPEAPVRLIGHSMGGNIAGLYAGIRPQRIRWLVSLEGFGLRRVGAEHAPQRYREWLDQVRAGPRALRQESPQTLAAALMRRNPRLTPAIAEYVARAWIRPHSVGDTAQLHFDPWHRLVNPMLYRREEAEACWREILSPVLIVSGKESEYRQHLEVDGDLDRYVQCFRNADVADFEHLGHMLHHEAPEEVAAKLAAWMQQQDLATA
jgi:pimeloyl-ACP methyl ester carboxylesterase